MSGDAPDQLPEEFSGFNLSVTFLHTGMPVLSKSDSPGFNLRRRKKVLYEYYKEKKLLGSSVEGFML